MGQYLWPSLLVAALATRAADAAQIRYTVTGHVERAYGQSARHLGIFRGDPYSMTFVFETGTPGSEDVPPTAYGTWYDRCVVAGSFTVGSLGPAEFDPGLDSVGVVWDDYPGSFPSPNWTDRFSLYAATIAGGEQFRFELSGLVTSYTGAPSVITAQDLPREHLAFLEFPSAYAQVTVLRSQSDWTDLSLTVETFEAVPGPGGAALLGLAVVWPRRRRARV